MSRIRRGLKLKLKKRVYGYGKMTASGMVTNDKEKAEEWAKEYRDQGFKAEVRPFKVGDHQAYQVWKSQTGWAG